MSTLRDEDITTSPTAAVPGPGGDADGTDSGSTHPGAGGADPAGAGTADADGTDSSGGDADGTDSGGGDADGTDSSGGDADGTDS